MYQCFLLTPVFYGVRVTHLFSFLYYFFIVVSLCSVTCVAFVSDLSIQMLKQDSQNRLRSPMVNEYIVETIV
jgi:hypothetical protein